MSFLISATASSGLPVSFSVDSGPCALVDHGDGTATITLTGALGTCRIRASQAGNFAYNPAPDVVNSFDVVGVPDEDLESLTWHAICGSGDFHIGGLVDSEVLIESTPGFNQSQGGYAEPYMSTDGLVEFRFPTNDSSQLVRIAYQPSLDCALISMSAIEFGWECVLAVGETNVRCVQKENSGVNPLAMQIATPAWSPTTIFMIKVTGRQVTFLVDGVLVATGPDLADGTDLNLFVRVDTNSTIHTGKVALRRYRNTA